MGIFTISAAYRDGRVYFSKKNYPAGIFATNFLNKYFKNDTAARISVFSDEINQNILNQLKGGYLDIRKYVKAGELTLESVKSLPKLPIYSFLDIEYIKNYVFGLFSESNGERICEYFAKRGRIGQISQDEIAVDNAYHQCDFKYIDQCEKLIDEVKEGLTFFNNISNDMYFVHKKLTAFIDTLPNIGRYDEGHLLPVATDIFGKSVFQLREEFIEVKKNAKSPCSTVARKLYFDSFYSFIITDFFEGLHYGHYPRQCEICGKYFLMQSAIKQRYCSNGIAPQKLNGKTVTCRKYGAAIHRKELSQNNPIVDIYTKRCSAIRTELGRGTISPEFAQAAKMIAKKRKTMAIREPEYAKVQYIKDLSREKLYSDTEKELEK